MLYEVITMFTGDSSGNWLYAALHKFGFASRLLPPSKDDGMKLTDTYITRNNFV